jgi:hypothetical protein
LKLLVLSGLTLNQPTMKIIKISLLLLILSVGISCDSDDEVGVTKTQYLTVFPWVIGAVDSGDATMDTEFYAYLSNATFTFKAEGTFSFVFEDTPADTGKGNWEFNDGETALFLNIGTQDEDEWKIISIDQNNFVFTFEESDPVIRTVKITLKH